jgi:hypothetical protein
VNIRESTSSYESWMREWCVVVESDLKFKHVEMRKDPFSFFRATYYRWAQLWPEVCNELSRAPKVLSVGDLHVGSFGTWRDAEGRLCWGVDDFDEAWPLPYTNDLVRLAASVKIVAAADQLTVKMKHACEAILDGYLETLRRGGEPFVLAEQEQFIEKLGVKATKPAADFWSKMNRLPVLHGELPLGAKKALDEGLPHAKLQCKIVRRKAGMGSLGQARFVALASFEGGWIAREIKSLLPSASAWLGGKEQARSYHAEAINAAVRSRDPFQRTSGPWILRRLSPDSNPIEISDLPKNRDEEHLLRAMGCEVANAHLGRHPQPRDILAHVHSRKPDWLRYAARSMSRTVVTEWKQYLTA